MIINAYEMQEILSQLNDPEREGPTFYKEEYAKTKAREMLESGDTSLEITFEYGESGEPELEIQEEDAIKLFSNLRIIFEQVGITSFKIASFSLIDKIPLALLGKLEALSFDFSARVEPNQDSIKSLFNGFNLPKSLSHFEMVFSEESEDYLNDETFKIVANSLKDANLRTLVLMNHCVSHEELAKFIESKNSSLNCVRNSRVTDANGFDFRTLDKGEAGVDLEPVVALPRRGVKRAWEGDQEEERGEKKPKRSPEIPGAETLQSGQERGNCVIS